MNTIVEFMRKRYGYARMKDLKASGFQTRDIRTLFREGRVVKIKPGLYRLSDAAPGEHSAFVEVCLAMPKAVVCLTSALAFHELTTFVPTRVTFAIPMLDKPITLESIPSEHFYFSRRVYSLGIEEVRTHSGVIRVYCREKTVCDAFRFRNRLGEDLALEALKEYLRRRDRDLHKLAVFAEMCRVKGVVAPYTRALVA